MLFHVACVNCMCLPFCLLVSIWSFTDLFVSSNYILIRYVIIFLQQINASAGQNSLALVPVDQDGCDITEKRELETGTLSQKEAVVDASKVMTNIRVHYAISNYHCAFVCYWWLNLHYVQFCRNYRMPWNRKV